MCDYFCTNCGADLDVQPGFDPREGYFVCVECGQLLLDPEDEDPYSKFEDVGWFCDECGAYLNRQDGFNDWCGTWECTKCGYVNNISEDEIYESIDEVNSRRNANMYDDCEKEEYDDYSIEDYEEESEEYDEYVLEDYEERDDYDTGEYEEDSEEEDDDYYDANQEYQDDGLRDELSEQEELLRREEERRVRAEKRKEKAKKIWRVLTKRKQSLGFPSKQCCNMNYDEVIRILKEREFYNIKTSTIEDLNSSEAKREGQVEKVSINGISVFDETTTFMYNSKIDVAYHVMKRQYPPFTSKSAKRKNVDDVVSAFVSVGFENVETVAVPDLITGWITKKNSVESIRIEGAPGFKKSDRIRVNAKITITYHSFNGR